MKHITHEQRVIQLAEKLGTLRTRDLAHYDIPRVVLTRLVQSGRLERVGRGLYRLPELEVSEKDAMIKIARQVPKAIFCLLTALQFYDLTTQIPREIWIAMPKGSHVPRIEYPQIQMVQYSGDAYSEGVSVVTVDQVDVRIYNPAKTVVDCFRHRNKLGLDIALEALQEVIRQRKTTRDELFYYAKMLRVNKIMQPYLQVIE